MKHCLYNRAARQIELLREVMMGPALHHNLYLLSDVILPANSLLRVDVGDTHPSVDTCELCSL
jgi:hypothetical protein